MNQNSSQSTMFNFHTVRNQTCSVDPLDEIAGDLRDTLPLTALSPGEPQLFPDKVTIATTLIFVIMHFESVVLGRSQRPAISIGDYCVDTSVAIERIGKQYKFSEVILQ